MKHFLFLFFVIGLSNVAFAQNNLTVERKRLSIPASRYVYPYSERSYGQIKREFNHDGWLYDTKRDYQLYVPDGYTPEKAYPMVVLLHGAQRTGVSLVEKWIPLADKAGLILVGPTNPKKYWPATSWEADLIEGIVTDVTKDVSIDKSRLFLFGHSSGGHFASYIAIIKPELFTAITVHAGYNNVESLKNLKRKTPIAFFAGQNDNVVRMANTAASAQDFAAYGHETLFIEYVGHNHWYYTAAHEINMDALNFMGKYTK